MRSQARTRRNFLRSAALGALALSTSPGRLLAASNVAPRAAQPLQFATPEGGRVVLDPARRPTTFQEAPMLAELVRQRRLPPVQDRIGRDPLVLEPLHEIGHYGGTLRRAFTGPSDSLGATRFASGPDGFLYWDCSWQTVVPNIARAFEIDPDGRTLRLFLRRGMRWSDGVAFTADDVIFWYTDMYLDRRVVGGPSPTLRIDDQDVLIEKVDDWSVQLIAPKAYSLLPELLAGYSDVGGPSIAGRVGMGGYAPMHYLSRFHPKYRAEADVTREARQAGFANWGLYLKNRNDWVLNPALPVLSPWRVESAINTQNFALVRNAFSVWVDTAGNQLPYIDRIQHTLCANPEIVSFKALAGELDFQERHLDIARLPMLLKNRVRSAYQVFLDPYEGSDLGIRLNLSYSADPQIGALLGNVIFRRALSLAIDRNAINESFMLGMGRPSAAVPAPQGKYFPGDEWATRWAVLDVVAANRLLDEDLGLRKRDAAGFRMRPDRRERLRLECLASPAHVDFPGIAEMIRDQWRLIGVDLDVRIVDSNLWVQRAMAGTLQMTVHVTSAEDPFGYPDLLFPYTPNGTGAIMGPDFARWFQSAGRSGQEPPATIKAMMTLWRQGQSADAERRLRIGRQLIRMHVDQVLSIGLISAGLSNYGIHLAKNDLGNVPRRVINTPLVRSPANALPMTFYFRS